MPTKTSVGPNEVVRVEFLRLKPPLGGWALPCFVTCGLHACVRTTDKHSKQAGPA
jgi:hypothetical protein